VTIEDLASVNGTIVNGKRISGRQLVYPGDRLEVGPVQFVVQYNTVQEPMEAIPLASGSDDDVPEVEQVDDDAEAAPLKLLDDDEDESSGEDVIAEIDEAGGLHLPESGELRDLLAQMDDPKPKKKKNG